MILWRSRKKLVPNSTEFGQIKCAKLAEIKKGTGVQTWRSKSERKVHEPET